MRVLEHVFVAIAIRSLPLIGQLLLNAFGFYQDVGNFGFVYRLRIVFVEHSVVEHSLQTVSVFVLFVCRVDHAQLVQ